ncbi:MAG: DMT family transporter [Pseudomonadota bacterium]
MEQQHAIPKITDWALLALLVALWGSAYGLNRVAVANLSPIAVTAIRLWVGAGFLGAIVMFNGIKMPPLSNIRAWASMAATGIIGSLLPFFLIAKAQVHVPSAVAAIYLSASPLAVAALAHFLVPNEKITKIRALGVLLGLVGIVILFLPNLMQIENFSSPLWAQAFLIIGAFCYGLALIIVRLTSPSLDPIGISFGFVLCSAIASTPFLFLNQTDEFARNYDIIASWICAVLLGIGPTAIASILYVGAARKIGPVMVSNTSNLVPFFALAVGFLIFHEAIPATAIWALMTILCGVYLLQVRAKT